MHQDNAISNRPGAAWAAVLCAGILIACGTAAAQDSPPAPVVSPEVDGTSATFRIRAPGAESVKLASPGDMPTIGFGADGLEMNRDADGVWSLRVADLPAGAYRYAFNVDGVTVLDPSNRNVSQSNANAWSLYSIAGSAAMDMRNVPHGAVAEVWYESGVLGATRRMHVYTPPGYASAERVYPVFYLLHGAMDGDDSWSTVGRANFILDNLIADGKVAPMIVVMPDGHTEPFVFGASALPLDDFASEFARDIKPYVERNYRVAAGRQNTAIAGLSMGGAQTLEIAMNALDDFAYVGVFSSGVFGVTEDDSWASKHRAALGNEALKGGLELVWFSTGSEDFLLDTTEATVALLEDNGFDVEYAESGGGHTWLNWRDYLQTFSARLFR